MLYVPIKETAKKEGPCSQTNKFEKFNKKDT